MISKIAPLMILGMAAQSYHNKTKKGKKKMKGDLNKDGKMSKYEKKRSKAIQKAVLKQSKKKSKSNSANTGDGTSAAFSKYKK